jgi:S1-C subfamily serine protease
MHPPVSRRSRLVAPLLVAVALAAGAGLPRAGVSRASAQDLNETRRIEVARRLQESTVSIAAGSSTGSGFVVGPERWILTNAHVAEGGRWGGGLLVRFSSGTRLPARVLAFDPAHDLAVLQVEGTVPARPLDLGNSDAVQVGQTVLAFGSPFGLDGTLTQGIVSARRDLPAMGGQVRGLIQTDATINPGNSGGPLVNAQGEVIGVNTAILSRSGGSQGIGFAVPVSYVTELLANVRAGGRGAAGRGQGGAPAEGGNPSAQAQGPDASGLGTLRNAVWLGIVGEDFQAAGFAGVRVQRVLPGSPAQAAGILGAADPAPDYVRQLGIPWTGHVILGLDGQPIRTMAELTSALGSRQPGTRAVVSVTVGPGVLSGETVVKLAATPREYRATPGGGRPRQRVRRAP